MSLSNQILEESPPVFEFAGFSFKAKEKILKRGAETISMPPKTCELLAVLLENHGELLTKEEIFQKVWADTFVEEANLSHHIAVLRKALGENQERKFIETVTRRGYRFVAPVSEVSMVESSEIVMTERVKTLEIVNAETETVTEPEPLPGRRSWLTPQKAIISAALVLLIFGSAVFLFWRVFSGSKNNTNVSPSEIKIRRLMPDSDTSLPAVSPDGTSIVFVKFEKEQATMWRKNIASGEMTQLLPTFSTVNDFIIYSIRFSPDGRWIYYKRLAHTDGIYPVVYRIGTNGGTPQKVATASESEFSISPDGRQIAFVRDAIQLFVADLETGTERVVASRNGEDELIRGNEVNEGTAWSPDGSRIVFSVSKLETNRRITQLWEINLSSGSESQIPIDKDFGQIRQIEWLPDGQGLLVTRRGAAMAQIRHVAYPSGETRRISSEADDFWRIRLSANGQTLVGEQVFGHVNIWIAPLDDLSRKRQITFGAAARQGRTGVSYTPDGKIIYTSLENDAVDLWTVDADGSNRKQLTVNAGSNNFGPFVTKDGRYIIFQSNRNDINHIWRMDADGHNPVQLSRGVDNWNPSLSPENEVYYMTYLAKEKNFQVLKVPVEGGDPVPGNDHYYGLPPIFSPDGKWMIFYGSQIKDDQPRFCLAERATGKMVRYFDEKTDNVRWMPDSKDLIYTKGNALWRQPVEGGEPKLIADFSPNRIYHWNVSPDGKQIVFSFGFVNTEIVAIENFQDPAK